MSESKVSASREVYSPQANNVSRSDGRTPLRRDVAGSGDIRTFEFEGCSTSFGVALENKDHRSPSRTRTTLGNIKIAEILPDCLAKRDGRLAVGDQVLEINGHDLSRASLERARWYLGSTLRSGKLKIRVLRDTFESKNIPLSNGTASPMEKEKVPQSANPVQKNTVKKIHILKDSRGLGVQISMKLNHVTGEKGVFVSDISPGGAAARDGRLKEGDELLLINGHSLIGITQQEAVDLLRASPKLIQLVISTQGDAERQPTSRGRSDSYEILHTNDMMDKKDQLVKMKRLAASADNLYDKRNKNSLERTKMKNKTLEKELEKDGSQVDNLQLLANGPSRIVDQSHRSDKDKMDKYADIKKMPYDRDSNLPLNGNTKSLANGRNHLTSSSSESSIEVSSLKSEDLLFSKEDESPDSEPLTLEGKPLTKSSGKMKSSPSLSPKMAKKQTPPSPLLSNSKEQGSNNKSSLAPGQISPSLPRPQSPGGLGIAFPARYLGDASPKVMTVGVPTPLKVIGSNERDSPEAKRKGSNDAMARQNCVKEMEEEIVTIVLVKGSGKGLGFTIVGGKGSPHGDLAVYVKNILPGGAAEADGRMKRGDELLSVNATPFEGFTHQEALDTFKNIRRGIVTLKVRRNSPGAPSLSAFTTPRSSPGSSRRNSKDVTEESTSSSNASSPTMLRKLRQKRSKKGKTIEIVLYKEPGCSLGIGLGGPSLSSKFQGIFVQCIIEGSPAANDGRLRHGDQLLEINDQKLEGLSVENVYSILDKVPPGKVYIKVLQSETSDKLPLELNDALTKLQNERQILDKKMPVKLKSTGTASTLSAASESSESCENMTSLSSSCEPLIPLSTEPNKKKKSQALSEPEHAFFGKEPDTPDFVEDVYTIIKQSTGGLGMGVTIDKSRGNTIVERVSVKSVTKGGSAALARSPRGVGLILGDQIIEVNGTHLRGMDQEDVIKIFRDLPSSTQMKIRRSKTAPKEKDSSQNTEKKKESLDKTPAQEPVPLPKPPEHRRRSSLRNKMHRVKPEALEDKTTADVKMGDISPSEHPNNYTSQNKKLDPKDVNQGGSKVAGKADEIVKSNGLLNGEESHLKKTISDSANTSQNLNSTNSVKLQVELGDNLIVPTGYRKMTLSIKKSTNATLGISLVPSYGKLKGYFQIRRLLSGMVCAQDGQLHIGDRLVSVNGVSLIGVKHSMALQLLKKPVELVTFVILREGLETQGKTSSVPGSKNESSTQTSSMPGAGSVRSESNGISMIPKSTDHEERIESKDDSSPKSADSGIRTKTPKPSVIDETEKTQRVFSPSSSESQQNSEATEVNRLGDVPSSDSEDETSRDKPPELPCSPPPPPLLDIDDLLDGDLSILSPPPSFSPLPPPLSELASGREGDLHGSLLPVVSPPPALTPEMKEFMEQDIFGPGQDHKYSDDSGQGDQIFPESSASLSQADSPDGLDVQSLTGSDDLSTSRRANMLFSEQCSLTEEPLLLTQSLASSSTLPAQTKLRKTNDSDMGSKPGVSQVRSSSSKPDSPTPVGVNTNLASKQPSNEPSKHDDKTLDTRTLNSDLPGLVSPLQSEGTSERRNADVELVEGRRDETVPFVITYQKKFRSLGMKVDQTEDGRVIVTEVSSFGLVGKDGSIRFGDVLLSISDTPLDGVPLEVVQDMIKNCPRGDVRVVAEAGPKPPRHTSDEEIEIQESPLSKQPLLDAAEVLQPEEFSLSASKAQESHNPYGALLSVRVDLPVELVPQDSSYNATNVVTSKGIQGVIPPKPPRQRCPDKATAPEQCQLVTKNGVLEEVVFDDLPPPILPPPLPLETSVAPEGDLIVQDTAQKLAFEPPSIFDDFFGKSQTNPGYDSEVDHAEVSGEAPSLVLLDSQPGDHSDLEMKNEPFIVADAPSSFEQESATPIKPPSLFGDDTESLLSLSLAKPALDSFDEDTTSLSGGKSVSIKPPSLFDDDLESLPSLPLLPSSPNVDRHSTSNRGSDITSSSSSPFQSPWLKQKPFDETVRTRHSNATVTSGPKPRTHSPSRGNIAPLEVTDPFGDVPFEPSDVQDDDMSSLPPAPPPPQSPVNSSPSWSFRASNEKASATHEQQNLPYISAPLQPPAKPERKNSKKRILPLRIRSKKGKKPSEQRNTSPKNDPRNESLPDAGPTDFDGHSRPVALNEPPEDDMESLPPAPPPPRMSPLTVESLENFVDGYQPMKAAQLVSLATEEKTAIVTVKEETSSSVQSSKKKKKSFRRHVVDMDVTETFPEPLSQSTPVPPPSETNAAVDILVQQPTPVEDEIAVTDSSDAMSPPPLPPEMELWSEAETAEAELALLDQILSLEDSSKSGTEQSSEGGSTPAFKRVAFPQVTPDKASTDAKTFPDVAKSASDQSERFEGSLESSYVPSPQKSCYTGDQPELPSVDATKINEASESAPSLLDSVISTRNEIARKEILGRFSKQLSEDNSLVRYDKGSEIAHQGMHSRLSKQPSQDSDVLDHSDDSKIVHQGLPGRLSKQPSEDSESGNVVKQRRPAPPIPIRTGVDSKAGGVTRKPLPAGLGIAVLPSRLDIKPKNVPPVHHPSPKYQKEDTISPPGKDKKKLFSKGHKSKQKQADSKHLESLDDNPEGRERSRSWTKRLFGFRSRSKSRDKTMERDDKSHRADRSRSVSPPRGLFSRHRRSSPSPPLPSTKKSPTSKQRKGIADKKAYKTENDDYAVVVKSSKRPVHPTTLLSSFESTSRPSEGSPFVEGNNNNPDPGGEEDVMSQVENNVVNAESHLYDEVLRKQDESDQEEVAIESDRLSQEVHDLTVSENHRTDLIMTTGSVYSSVEKARADRPLPPPPTRHEFTKIASDMQDKVQGAIEDKDPKKPVTKPPVQKKPLFLKSSSSPRGQQQRTVDELKRKFNKTLSYDESPEIAAGSLEQWDDGLQDAFSDPEDLPSPGPPMFKPIPPPFVLQQNGKLSRTEDESAVVCPSSPGPPRFKPIPPPLPLKANEEPSRVSDGETTDILDSPGPPKFKPEPPPLLLRNDNNALEREDRPSLPDQPNFTPLPPLPVAANLRQRHDEGPSVTRNPSAVEDLPQQLQNEQEVLIAEQRIMKPLPPIPTGFDLKTNKKRDAGASANQDDNRSNHKLLARQDAKQYDSIEDDNREDILENQPEKSEANVGSTEENHFYPASEEAEPPVLHSEILPVNSHGDDFESSDISSEWDDTCSSNQDDLGSSVPGARFARSASFSVGDSQIKQRPATEEGQRTLPPGNARRPPPPLRRRSSSLPHLFPESETSKKRSDAKDYWHTGNLQELINSRNQEPDLDEGVIEVQLLKEQQSIGLMVVGGLDTHLGMLYIKDIQPDSPAANCKRLRTGDQLLQVNDKCLIGVTHGEALNILKHTPPLVKLTVARKKDKETSDLDLKAERSHVSDFEEPIVNKARESSTVSKTSEELSFSPPTERSHRPKSCISLSSFGTSVVTDLSTSINGSFEEPDEEYVPAYLEPESPTLNLRQDDVPVTIIDGIPGEDSDFTEEDEPRSRSKSVSWAVSDDTSKVFTVELLKNGRAGLGLSVSGGVDTSHGDITVRQILSSSVTAQNGLVKKGDILLSVNGKSFKGLRNMEALTLLKNTPDRVTLVLCRPVGSRKHERSHADREVFSDSEAWPTKEEMTKKILVNTNNNTLPTLEQIPLDLAKHNGEHSKYDRLKKKLFSNSGSKSLKERLQKVPQGPTVSEITLEKGASGLGFSLGGGQDSLYGDAPIHVRYVFKDSVAGRSGKLRPGDEILEVNGQRVAYMTSVDALELIRKLPYGPVFMKIRRK